MSKRAIDHFRSDRKRPKLDVTISDHNFPLSQTTKINKESNLPDEWGDDNEDEILLIASQACEIAGAGADNSILPDYNNFIAPAAHSTQIHGFSQIPVSEAKLQNNLHSNFVNNLTTTNMQPVPSTSKDFQFKKPSNSCQQNMNNADHITPTLSGNPNVNIDHISNDLVISDKIKLESDSQFFYKQLLQLQEENSKLKSQNGNLLEKCVTKEGEVSILRSQLKTCQSLVDNARLERLKTHEQTQMEWNDKLGTVNREVKDLKTQLEFKNLELMNIKDRCRVLESSKVKLTQITVSGNDRSLSQKFNHLNESHITSRKNKYPCSTISVQTEKNNYFKLHKCHRKDLGSIRDILGLITQPTCMENICPIEDSDTLKDGIEFAQSKYQISSMLHSLNDETETENFVRMTFKLSLQTIYENLSKLIKNEGSYDIVLNTCICVVDQLKLFLKEVLYQLETVKKKITTAFQKEMDEKYVNSTCSYDCINEEQLITDRAFVNKEQAINCRRATAVLACLCAHYPEAINVVIEENPKCNNDDQQSENCLSMMLKICEIINATSCGIPFSGLLMAFTLLLLAILDNTSKSCEKLVNISLELLLARPLLPVFCKVVHIWRKLSVKYDVTRLCIGAPSGNLKMDFEQGVYLYKKDSCPLQVMLRQVEVSMKLMEEHNLFNEIATTSKQLIGFYRNCSVSSLPWCDVTGRYKCDCPLRMAQVLVFSLKISAISLKKCLNLDAQGNHVVEDFKAVCKCGIAILNIWLLHNAEFSSQLGFYEGFYQLFIEHCDNFKDILEMNEVQENILAELVMLLQPNLEEIEPPKQNHIQIWQESFKRFTITD